MCGWGSWQDSVHLRMWIEGLSSFLAIGLRPPSVPAMWVSLYGSSHYADGLPQSEHATESVLRTEATVHSSSVT